MTKNEFLSELRRLIDQLPPQDVQKSLDFYAEIIDDRIESGMSEEEAVAAMAPFDEITEQILMDIPLPRLVKAKLRPSRALRVWEIVLLILGSPLWFPLLISAFAVVFSVYAVFWSVILSLYAVDLAFADDHRLHTAGNSAVDRKRAAGSDFDFCSGGKPQSESRRNSKIFDRIIA